MELIISIVLFILFIITAIVVIYLIYDYLQYKQNVDETIKAASHQINKEFSKVIDNISESSSNILLVDEKINNYNDSLKHFFEFKNDESTITNEKMFKHAFSGVIPNLKLLSEVSAIHGLNVHTSSDLINNKNMRICNDNDGCVNMNVNDFGFNITPNSKVNNLLVNTQSGQPLSRFDLQNNSIYLGGNNSTNSPFYIEDNNVYMKNVSIADNAGEYVNNIPDKYNYISSNLNLISPQINAMQNVVNTVNNNISDLTNKDTVMTQNIQELQNNINERGILVYYYVDKDSASTANDTCKIKLNIDTSTLHHNLIGKTIQVSISKSILGNYDSSIQPDYIFNTSHIDSISSDVLGENVIFTIRPKTFFNQTSITMTHTSPKASPWFNVLGVQANTSPEIGITRGVLTSSIL